MVELLLYEKPNSMRLTLIHPVSSVPSWFEVTVQSRLGILATTFDL
jgi:hypothetical protein